MAHLFKGKIVMADRLPNAILQELQVNSTGTAQKEQMLRFCGVAVQPVIPGSHDNADAAGFDELQELLIFRTVG